MFWTRCKIITSMSLILALLAFSAGCVYYNMFFNAKQEFKQAEEKTKQLGATGRGGGPRQRAGGLAYQDAIQRFSKVIEEHPNSKWVDDAYYYIGLSYVRMMEFAKAKRAFETLVTDYPESKYVEEANLWIAVSRVELGDRRAGRDRLIQLITEGSKPKWRAEALARLAGMHFTDQEYDSAAALYLRLAEEYPGEEVADSAHYKAGEALVAAGRADEAVEQFMLMLDNSPEQWLEYKTRMSMANAYFDKGEIDSGLTLLDDLARSDIFYDSLGLVQLLYGHGLEQDGSYEEAIDKYVDVTENFPRTTWSAEAYYRIGYIHQERYFDYAKAREYYDLAKKEFGRSKYARRAIDMSLTLATVESYQDEIVTGTRELNEMLGIVDSTTIEDTTQIVVSERIDVPDSLANLPLFMEIYGEYSMEELDSLAASGWSETPATLEMAANETTADTTLADTPDSLADLPLFMEIYGTYSLEELDSLAARGWTEISAEAEIAANQSFEDSATADVSDSLANLPLILDIYGEYSLATLDSLAASGWNEISSEPEIPAYDSNKTKDTTVIIDTVLVVDTTIAIDSMLASLVEDVPPPAATPDNPVPTLMDSAGRETFAGADSLVADPLAAEPLAGNAMPDSPLADNTLPAEPATSGTPAALDTMGAGNPKEDTLFAEQREDSLSADADTNQPVDSLMPVPGFDTLRVMTETMRVSDSPADSLLRMDSLAAATPDTTADSAAVPAGPQYVFDTTFSFDSSWVVDTTLEIELTPAAKRELARQEKLQEVKDKLAATYFNLAEVYQNILEVPDSALFYYEKLVEKLPENDFTPRAHFAIASLLETAFADTAAARDRYRLILNQYGTTDYAGAAIDRLGLSGTPADTGYPGAYYREAERLLFEEDKPESAKVVFAYVAEKFPQSIYAPKAAYAELLAAERAFSGGDSTLYFMFADFVDSFSTTQFASAAKEMMGMGIAPRRERQRAVIAEEDDDIYDSTLAAIQAEQEDTTKDPTLPVAPKPKQKGTFVYPASEVDQDPWRGTIVYKILIDFTGQIADHEVISQSYLADIDANAEQVIKDTYFDPDSIAPESLNMWYRFEVDVVPPAQERENLFNDPALDY